MLFVPSVLIGVLSLADGAEAFARRQIELNGLQAIVVSAVTSDTVDGVTTPALKAAQLSPIDAMRYE